MRSLLLMLLGIVSLLLWGCKSDSTTYMVVDLAADPAGIAVIEIGSVSDVDTVPGNIGG